MGKIITIPNLQERELKQFLDAKATRRDVVECEELVEGVKAEVGLLREQLQRLSSGTQQVFNLVRVAGAHNDALVRVFNERLTMKLNDLSFRDLFDQEFTKSIDFIGFLDTINPPGEHSAKDMKEKIQIVKNWNSQPENLPVHAGHFGLSKYVYDHPDEFTEEEVEELKQSLKLFVPKKEAVNEEVTEDIKKEAL